jgi:hypothetical protein
VGDVVDSELVVVLEELTDEDGTADVEALGAEEDATLVVEVDVPAAALVVVVVVTCAGAGVAIAFEITDFISVSSGAFSMRSVKTTDEVASVYFEAGR